MIAQIPEPTPEPTIIINYPAMILFVFVLVVCVYWLIRRRRTEPYQDSEWLEKE